MDQPGFFFTLLMFVAMIGPLVFVHELGHYLAGRTFGVKADQFAIGFGRELVGWNDKRGTRWKICMLPLGGYVRFAGDLNAASAPGSLDHLSPEERSVTFSAKPLWQRALIVLAGPVTNFLFAILVYATFIWSYGHSYTPAQIHMVMPQSPAAAAGLREGDLIVSVAGKAVDRFEDVSAIVSIRPGEPLPFAYRRDGRLFESEITPERIREEDRFGNVFYIGRIGIARPDSVIVERNLFESVHYGAVEVVMMTKSMARTLYQVVSGTRSVKELGGPVKIAQYSGQQASLGLPNFVYLMALISINLGFINLLPIPMLDGGHLLMYAIEAVRRQPVNAKVQEWAFMSGFAMLVSLMVILTWNDLASFGLFDHLTKLLGQA